MASGTVAQQGAAKGYFRELGLPAMFGAVVLLVSATLLLGVNISTLRANLARIDHSQKVLNQVSQLEVERLGLELALRGYTLTGDKQFLKIQHEGDVRRNTAIAELGRLVQSDPEHAAEINKLLVHIKQHADFFSTLTGVGPDRADVMAKVILDPKLRAWKYRVRDELAHLRATELGDLAARQHDIAYQLGRAFFLAVAIILVAFLLGGMGAWVAQIQAPPKP